MSKAVKKLFKGIKKAVSWVAKNIVPILAVAAIIYTGGAALGYFQGVAGGGGAVGMQGIQSAWGVGQAGASAALNTEAAAIGTAEAGAIETAGLAELGAADVATNAAVGDIAAAEVSGMAAPSGLMAPVGGGPLPAGAKILDGAAAAAKGAGAFMSTPGGGFATAAALQAGGAYLSQTAEEKRLDEERARYNRETNAYGVNRNGGKVGGDFAGGSWDETMRAPPAGLMTPRNTGPAAPSPTTIDELIAARSQRTA